MATTVTNPSSFGRGRGRGRGLRAANMTKPGPPPPPPVTTPDSAKPPPITHDSTKPPTVISETPKTIETPKESKGDSVDSAIVNDIIKRMDNLTESEIMKTILPEIEAIEEKEPIEDLVKALSVKSISDPSFGVTASKLAAKVWDNKSVHSLIRNPLLKQAQEDYIKREKLDGNQLYGLCVYVCELFKRLRIRNTALKPVGDAVVQLLKELMQKKDKPSDEDIFYFYQELESVGDVIEDCLPAKMDELINIARQMVISTSLIPSMRCRLVQLIELHAAKWKMSDELKMMYEDMQQDLMSEGK